MELTGDLLRGHTDAIILSILSKGDNYGYQINYEILQLSDQAFSLTEATMYTCFKRLEGLQLIVSYWKDGLNKTKRKYYSITEYGKKALRNHMEIWKNSKILLDKFFNL